MTKELRYELLTEKRLSEAASVAAAAFEQSPAYVFICGAGKTSSARKAFLTWFFEGNFYIRLNTDCCRCVYEGDELVAFFMFVKPTVPHPTLWDMLCAGLISGLFSYGLAFVQRLFATKGWFEAREKEIFGDRETIRLERVVVLPSCQGRGVGSRMLRAALEEADRLGLPVVLHTQEERNVTFYKRLGFEVADLSVCEHGGYKTWAMLREPSGALGIGGSGVTDRGRGVERSEEKPGRV